MTSDSAGESLVSVVMIFFNAEKFIREAIDSIIAQTYTAWELMLVDDGSSDGSTQIAQAYVRRFPGKIEYLEHEHHRNQGMSTSRNLGIRHSAGKYIAFLDADDAWLPHMLERQVAIMESQPRTAMIYGRSQYWHSWTGKPEDAGRDFVPDPGVPAETLFEPPALLNRLYPFGPATTPPPSDFLVRHDAVKAVGGFEDEFRGIHQLYDDQAFLVKMYLHGSIFVSSEVWDKYRIHPDSCGSAAAKGGYYDSIRGFFLKWFEGYLSRNGITDAVTWDILRKAVQEAMVQLRIDNGAVARLLHHEDDADWVRIEIERSPTGVACDIQLNRPFYTLHADRSYAVQFRAKADSPRALAVGVAAAHAPWIGLGLYRLIELTREWQTFDLEFAARSGDDNARIHFDVGSCDASLEVADLSIRTLPGGQVVAPSLAPIPSGESDPF